MKKISLLIVRPKNEAEEMASSLCKLNIQAEPFPIFEIETLPISFSKNLKPNKIIFTSVNAVRSAPKDIQYFTEAKIFAVGESTKKALLAQNFLEVIAPVAEGGTKQLLDLKEFENVTEEYIWIFTGENPKPLLAQKLRKKSAFVEEYFCYRRVPLEHLTLPQKKQLNRKWDFILFSSQSSQMEFNRFIEKPLDFLTDHVIFTHPNLRLISTVKNLQSSNLPNASIEFVFSKMTGASND